MIGIGIGNGRSGTPSTIFGGTPGTARFVGRLTWMRDELAGELALRAIEIGDAWIGTLNIMLGTRGGVT